MVRKEKRRRFIFGSRLEIISLLLLAALMATSFCSCDIAAQKTTAPLTGTETLRTETLPTETMTSETEEQPVETLDIEVDGDLVAQKARDFINLNNLLYNKKRAYLYVAPPMEFNTENKALQDAVTEALVDEFVETLDLTDLFGTKYRENVYENTDVLTFDASLAVYEKLNEMAFDNYVLQRNFSMDVFKKNVLPKEIKVSDLEEPYFFPFSKYKSPFAVTIGEEGEIENGSYLMKVTPFDTEITETDASYESLIFGGKEKIIKTTSRWGDGRVVVIHNLPDYMLPAFMAHDYAACTFIDISETDESFRSRLMSEVNGSDYDLCISIVDVNREYDAFFTRNYTKAVYTSASAPSTFKDNNRMYQVDYNYLDPSVYLKRTLGLRDAAEASGAQFVYIQAPFKILKEETVLPPTIKDGTNKTADKFMELLDANNVTTLDIRQSILDYGVDASNFFLKTEHHWSHTGAFFGYTAVIDFFRDSLGLDVNRDGYYSDISNYNVDVYKNAMCSYYANGFPLSFCGADPITLIYPKEETQIEVKYSNKTTRSGSFYDAVFDTAYLQNLDTIIQKRYQCYIGNDTDMCVLKNENAETDKRILIIKDSFALPVAAWLSQNFSEVTLFDTRYMSTTATNYVKNNKYDVVVVLYNASILNIAAAMYQF